MAAGTRGSTERGEIVNTLTQLLNDKIDPITLKLEKLDSIETSVGNALEELRRLTDLEVTVEHLSSDVKVMDEELNELKSENRMLKEKWIKQEMFSRRNNLKVWGIKVDRNDDIEAAVLKTFHENGLEISPSDVERVHFAGPAVNKRPRPILMKLCSCKVKQAIMDKKGTLKDEHINISDDYPKEVHQRRQLILPTFFKALDKCPNLNPKLRVDSLILGGREYTINNITSIPVPELHPQYVFSPTQNGVTAFFSKYSPLSNHFPAKFQSEGQVFYSSEQYLMYKKAKQFKDDESAQRILSTKSPVEAKLIGKKISNFNAAVWKEVAEDYMYTAMYLKFRQNEDLALFLKNTNGTELVEASSSDTYWGVGISLRSKNLFDPTKWRGKNKAGKVLTRVRQTLS